MSDLRLASIDGEQTLSVGPIHNIADEAATLANMIENGELNASSALVIVEVEGFVKLLTLGPSPSIAEALGILDLAKARIVAGAFQ